LACGDVTLFDAGIPVFGKVDFHSSFSPLHKRTNVVNSRDDVKYDQAKIDAARNAIHAKLRNGIPVRVGCAWGPRTAMLDGGALRPDRFGGHFALIVGCDDAKTRFLFVEVWGGCSLRYGGGITGHTTYPICDYLGIFELQNLSRGPVLMQAASTGQPVGVLRDGQAGFTTNSSTRGMNTLLEVISGPTS
jgi:hypothetical protein